MRARVCVWVCACVHAHVQALVRLCGHLTINALTTCLRLMHVCLFRVHISPWLAGPPVGLINVFMLNGEVQHNYKSVEREKAKRKGVAHAIVVNRPLVQPMT